MKPPEGAASSPGGAANRLITLDVVVADQAGHAVAGLQQQDFTLLDNKLAQKVIAFHAAPGTPANADPPVEVILVVDEVNTSFQQVVIVRQEIEKYLSQNGGQLALPVAILFFTDSGAASTTPSNDGKAVLAELKQHKQPLRNTNRAQGGLGAIERMNSSLRMLGHLADFEAKRPGRKLVIWMSPGWTFLASPLVQLSSKDQQALFRTVVGLSDALQRAGITLYNVNPAGSGGNALKSYYKSFLKGVTAAKQVEVGNLGLQVLASQSGGLVLNSNNDLAGEITTCVNDANAFYILTFEAAAGDGPNEYHALEVTIDKPGLEARTRSGYYARVEQTH
ncbi:MAG: VWA domain-containing protein [Candidatus Korobacteraceae bacterium]